MPELAVLSNLGGLKAFTLRIVRSDGSEGGRSGDNEAQPLVHLPVLRGLERLDLNDTAVDDEQLQQLEAFQRLVSLNVAWTSISGTGMSKLAKLKSLRELAIDDVMATASTFESLVALANLRRIHIALSGDENTERASGPSVPLDDQQRQRLYVLANEADRIRRALEKLRTTNRALVIDSGYAEFEETGNFEPPWLNRYRDLDAFAQRNAERR